MIRLFVVAVALALPALALAADRGNAPARAKHRVHAAYPSLAGAYPLSWRAKKVRHADRCWRTCQVEIGREFQACLRVSRPTECVAWNGGANLRCLHACRRSGGPWVRLQE